MDSSAEPTVRSRIRDAALAQFGGDGVNAVSIRDIARAAAVSPATVVRHFGSKDALRHACDEHVVGMVRGTMRALSGTSGPAAVSGFVDSLRRNEPARRYLARALLDGTPAASTLYDDLVDLAEEFLAAGQRSGTVRSSPDPRARAAVYLTWQLATVVLDQHLSRALETDEMADAALRAPRAGMELYSHGLFTDEGLINVWHPAS